jgi:hypothetical protein
MRRRFAAVLIGLGALVAGCSSAVTGNGTIAADASAPSGGASGSAMPSGSASPMPSASPSSGGGSDGTGRQSLSCSGTKISPSGSPYCFTVPSGFQDVSSSVTVDASIGQEKYRSAVAVGDRDLIIVSVYELRVDTDDIADATLEGELKTVLAQLARQGFTFDSTTAEKSTTDGARTFAYHAAQASSGLESDVYFLFSGKNELQVNCQWKDKEADVTKGCQAVLKSLQFKSVK